MELPDDFVPFNIVEVRFKGSRKEYFRNTEHLELYNGDYIAVESSVGFDVGTVSATGEIVRLQLKKHRIPEDSERLQRILRKASDRDLEKNQEMKDRENATLERARTIAFDLNLQMKISDIEIQGDGRKVILFYTAEQRVDFRELIRRYADEFRMKIEMRHISYREEASRLGGIGVCGRQLCCSTWLTDYKMVTTGAARTQNLSINMEKLAGQCGRLKCCLNYELDLYVEYLDNFPKSKIVKLETEAGTAYSRKTDILKQLMWFSYEDSQTWVALEVNKVKEYMEDNRQGKNVAALQDIAAASQVLDNTANEAPEIIGGAALLEDREMEMEMRKKREEQNRGRQGGQQGRQGSQGRQGAPGRQGYRGGSGQPQKNQPENRNQPPSANRPENRNQGPPKNRGEQRGPRPEHRGPRPDNRNRGPKPEGPPKP
jgi:cell fate regulator YaaT (PSP1 superfamily)